MPLATSYATPAQYRERAGKADTAEDAVIAEQLSAVSRYIDRRLRRAFGKTDAPEARWCDSWGGGRLWLPGDVAGSSGLAVSVDADGDGVAEQPLVEGSDYMPGPVDWSGAGTPYEYLDLLPRAVLRQWPVGRRTVQVTAIWGWPAVPEPIRELAIALTRQLRDMEQAGFTLTLEAVDAAIRLSPEASHLLRQVERAYGRPSLAVVSPW